MSVRTNTEFEAKLPSFIVKGLGLGSRNAWATIQCPRCEGEFTVEGKRFRAPLMSAVKPDIEIKGRSCPYCQATALVPREFYPKARPPQPRAKR